MCSDCYFLPLEEHVKNMVLFNSNHTGIKDMANLNFQQPPRSITSQSLSRNAFNSSSLSGHVTPTSNMFPGSTNSFTPQQLSPSRNNLPPAMGGRSLFNPQRSFSERRPVQSVGSVIQDWNANPVGSMGIGQTRSSYGSQNAVNSLQSVFSNANSNGLVNNSNNSPPLLDLSEFPSLTSRGQNDTLPQSNATMPGKQPYVGMVKAPTSESTEFTMSNEDFPALPGTQPTAVSENSSITPSASVSGSSSSLSSDHKLMNHDSSSQSEQVLSANCRIGGISAAPGAEKHQQLGLHQNKKGIQTFPEGKVTNIPPTMVKDQFGMVGLLTFIRAAETDPKLVSLALGQDLTTLGLNLNSPDNLYPTFGGPWSDAPCRSQDLDYNVPPEYLVNHGIREKLAQVKLTRYKEDLLFYLFYNYTGDVIQIVAASELYNREWRYHMEEKVWITPAPGLGVTEKTSTYERGTYYFFDTTSWRKVAKEFHLEYSKLETRPTVPPTGYSYV